MCDCVLQKQNMAYKGQEVSAQNRVDTRKCLLSAWIECIIELINEQVLNVFKIKLLAVWFLNKSHNILKWDDDPHFGIKLFLKALVTTSVDKSFFYLCRVSYFSMCFHICHPLCVSQPSLWGSKRSVTFSSLCPHTLAQYLAPE